MEKLDKFLDKKASYGSDSGFAPINLPSSLFDFQTSLTDWAIRKGRAAVFADCGMGKTLIQLVWADNIVRKTNRPVLVLTPLSVGKQTLSEAHKFGIEASMAIPGSPSARIEITNYEKLHHFNASDYAGVVLDESSILKNFNGTRKAEITEFMRVIPYRSLFTATAAPNDWEELGTSSEALGYMGYMDMLGKFFTSKGGSLSSNGGGRDGRRGQPSREKVSLRRYSERDFWRWVSSWSRAARMPSDLGFEDNGFILPELVENDVEVMAKRPPTGMLWDLEATDFFEEREAVNRTVQERCEKAAELVAGHDISIVWCHLDKEADLLKKIIPNSVEVSGSDSPEKKEEAADWFINGSDTKRVLISKPRIFGFGMNFQHCNHAVYFPTHSYEQYYQATRRIWRFGQDKPVIIDRVYTNGGKRMLESIDRKEQQAAAMFEQLVKHINNELTIKNTYTKKKVSLPQWLS